jgi:hypothetical protein
MLKPWYKSLGFDGSAIATICFCVRIAIVPIDANLKSAFGADSRIYEFAKPWIEMIRSGSQGGAGIGALTALYGNARRKDLWTPKFLPGNNKEDIASPPALNPPIPMAIEDLPSDQTDDDQAEIKQGFGIKL